ncbi:protein kinase [Ectobacillus antri]|uniref:Protein kinase n=1 Tax=Ectobacillus antri TaxID=2486280 RepID=A0ABT6H0Z4_9BACI|nr:protein kinase [Ectobacillus antri]MDG4656386.1 protein kinase [Ectobacillus antri]MDG5753061.1 protein kinase [Ectobacillus antri]
MNWNYLFAWFDRPLRQGSIVNNYQIKHTLGMGSYGFTYLAVSLQTQEEIVIKQLRTSKRRTASGRKSFQYEQSILERLKHPLIPKKHAAFSQGKQLFFTMDYVQGVTFEDLIFKHGQTFTEHEAFTILLSILQTVAYFHRLGIVHRDLRTPNLLWHAGQVHIIDFGLARYIGEQDERAEAFTDEKKLMREVHYRSDFYALGHFLLFLLYAGYKPTMKEERPWFEELILTKEGKHIIKRMLQIEQPYEEIDELCNQIQSMLKERETCCKSF